MKIEIIGSKNPLKMVNIGNPSNITVFYHLFTYFSIFFKTDFTSEFSLQRRVFWHTTIFENFHFLTLLQGLLNFESRFPRSNRRLTLKIKISLESPCQMLPGTVSSILNFHNRGKTVHPITHPLSANSYSISSKFPYAMLPRQNYSFLKQSYIFS